MEILIGAATGLVVFVLLVWMVLGAGGDGTRWEPRPGPLPQPLPAAQPVWNVELVEPPAEEPPIVTTLGRGGELAS